MMEKLYRRFDILSYKRLLKMQSQKKKEFFDVDGCGLEIEIAVNYEYRCRKYIATGLKKLKEAVGNYGKFVPDRTIGSDLNVEIVLVPLDQYHLEQLLKSIKEIVNFYENFSFDENCGVHANFRADDSLKRCFYDVLLNGYDSDRFLHNKYKTDFMATASGPDGVMCYDEYIDFQKCVSSKYAGVNFLKNKLVEIRTLDMNWENIVYVIGLYERAKALLYEKNEAV